jgi:hypothetical protein
MVRGQGKNTQTVGQTAAMFLAFSAFFGLWCTNAHADKAEPTDATPAPAVDAGMSQPLPVAIPKDCVRADRVLTVLPVFIDDKSQRFALRIAGEGLGNTAGIDVAGAVINRDVLMVLANTKTSEPLLRQARERLGVAVDVEDLLYFLDDVLAQRVHQRLTVVLSPGKARAVGILLHPDEVFDDVPHRYGEPMVDVLVTPIPKPAFAPPKDHAPISAAWFARYQNPEDETAMMQALRSARPKSDFANRVESLLAQLRAHGARVTIESTLRKRERGYLMYGAYVLSQATTEQEVVAYTRALVNMRRRYKLKVPIVWQHPDGWAQTVVEATALKDAYTVVYASRQGAIRSYHYDGAAIDVVVTNLPRRLTLTAPDGVTRSFDLSAPSEARDLNLTPRVVRFIEAHFRLEKVDADYPHWNDADHEQRKVRRRHRKK